jgi:hypothetical protein
MFNLVQDYCSHLLFKFVYTVKLGSCGCREISIECMRWTVVPITCHIVLVNLLMVVSELVFRIKNKRIW